MTPDHLKNIIEVLLLSANEALSITQLLAAFEEWERPDRQQVITALEHLRCDYQQRGIELAICGNTYRIQSKSEYSVWINRLKVEKPPTYSKAVLETLAIIAYKQPVTRADIEEIRGVAVSSHIIKGLLERQWIKIAAYRDVPGKPAVFVTTRHFLQYFNLNSLGDLPELIAEQSLQPTELL
ncbi:MAG: SMC-Scp complex subunit ScpB [Legionellaceae bacterium]|nr:SMC-Scp complex subunit ScpB [Legionellaceae bacterium]